MNRYFALRYALALVLAFLLWTPFYAESFHPQRPIAAQAPVSRGLPLNRFAMETKQTDEPGGFRLMRTAVGDDYFDGTSPPSRLQRHLALARQAGVKYLRCAFSWNAIEKEQGHYDWNFWDTLVELAEKNGIQLLPYVAYTPEWAAREARDFWRQPPRDPRVYADLMYMIAYRYRGHIRSWEIWNEPDNKDFWTGTADEFASMAKLAARRIRDGDPNAVLILGGMAYGPSKFFQRLECQYQIDEYVDVVAMHAYPESWLNERAETVFKEWIPAMTEMIRKDNSGAELWVNEMGYADYRLSANRASVYDTRVFYAYEHTRKYQAAMLFKFEVMALASEQVGLTGWYRIDDFPPTEKRLGNDLVNHHLGLVDRRGAPKPAFFALRFFNCLFGRGARVVHTSTVGPRASQSVINVFVTPQKEILVIAWLRSSLVDEVTSPAGTLPDNRMEVVSVSIPCSSAKLAGFYDPQGHYEKTDARVTAGSLQGIRLHGDRVFVAKLACGDRS